MSIRKRSKRIARRSLRTFLGAPRAVLDFASPSRRRIKRRLRMYAGPQRRRR